MNREHAARVLFEQLKRTIPIEAVTARYGLELKRSGQSLVGCCPIPTHQGSNAKQFVVSNGLWRCFSPSCDRGGSILELVSELEQVDIREAALLLSKWFAVKPGSDVQAKRRRKEMTTGAMPSHKVFLVEDRGEGKDPFWHRVGSAWPSKDGRGLQIQLPPGLSVAGRVVLREYDSAEEAAEDTRAKTQPQRKK